MNFLSTEQIIQLSQELLQDPSIYLKKQEAEDKHQENLMIQRTQKEDKSFDFVENSLKNNIQEQQQEDNNNQNENQDLDNEEDNIHIIKPKNQEEEKLNRLRKHFFTCQPTDVVQIKSSYDLNTINQVLLYTLSLSQKNFYSPLYQAAVIMKKLDIIENVDRQIEDLYKIKIQQSAINIKKGFVLKLLQQLELSFGKQFIKDFILELILADRLQIATEFCQKFEISNQEFPQIIQYQKIQSNQEQFLEYREKIFQYYKKNPKNYIENFMDDEIIKDKKLTKEESSQLINTIIEKNPTLEQEKQDLDRKYRLQIAYQFLQYYQLDSDQFQVLKKQVQHKQKSQNKSNKLLKIIKENTWEKVEEIFKNNISYLVKAVDIYIDKQKYQIAYNLITNNNLDFSLFQDFPHEKLEKQPNKLYSMDDYKASEEILGKKKDDTFLNLKKDFQKDLQFVDDSNLELLEKSINFLKNQKYLSIDAEWEHNAANLISETTIEDVEILQIACYDFIYIFDAFKLKKNITFKKFLYDILNNNKITIIGFGVNGDIKQVKRHFRLVNRGDDESEDKYLCNIIDLQQLQKEKNIIPVQHLKEGNCSLSDLVKYLIEKPMSKCEQFSNWMVRPLRKCQLHYAALDAYICLHLYKLIQDKY